MGGSDGEGKDDGRVKVAKKGRDVKKKVRVVK